MPHLSSAKKHIRKSAKQRAYNRAYKKEIRVQIKELLTACKSGAAEQMKKELALTAKKLDKAAARRVIHPNTAARRKARLARIVNKKLAQGQAPAPPAS